MFLSSEVAALAAKGVLRPAIFLRLAATTPVRAWSGVGDFAVPADNIETTAGAIYKGVGELQNFPALGQLINGAAERVEFTLSGVTSDILNLADAEAESVRFARANVGMMLLDADWQPAASMLWLWEGEADAPGASRNGQGEVALRTVSLSVGSIMTGRRRPKLANFTDTEQKRRSPTDRFCDRVAGYTMGTTRKWPV